MTNEEIIDTLAAATVACPDCGGKGGWGTGERLIYDGSIDSEMCQTCYGTGTIPSFLGARRKCPGHHPNRDGTSWVAHEKHPCFVIGRRHDQCPCNGTGEVPDYDAPIEAIEASLTVEQMYAVWKRFAGDLEMSPDGMRLVIGTPSVFVWTMPPADKIRAAKLRAIVAVVA